MEPYAIITPTRDRPKMLEFCKYQVSQFTIQPEKHYIIDYAPVSEDVDISERVFAGVQRAINDGIDLIMIAEDDDVYSVDYPEVLFGNKGTIQYDFFGFESTLYYHLRNKTWQIMEHQNRSSLFATGFRISSLKGFQWPKNTPFVDIALWRHALSYNNRLVRSFYPIGIKGHSEGKSGGRGHFMKMSNIDRNYSWLKGAVSNEAFEFYMSLI